MNHKYVMLGVMFAMLCAVMVSLSYEYEKQRSEIAWLRWQLADANVQLQECRQRKTTPLPELVYPSDSNRLDAVIGAIYVWDNSVFAWRLRVNPNADDFKPLQTK